MKRSFTIQSDERIDPDVCLEPDVCTGPFPRPPKMGDAASEFCFNCVRVRHRTPLGSAARQWAAMAWWGQLGIAR